MRFRLFIVPLHLFFDTVLLVRNIEISMQGLVWKIPRGFCNSSQDPALEYLQSCAS
ncbi:unnamed protein product [Callosobruchus maculatus]|uniref:Uncharacterized protein n=1 Tax=Callosobruchus maculatus TaxID=64391 RepID=A0A653BJB3_CALMS|nr:unnamed protein product [Callosobruchus maculatus]